MIRRRARFLLLGVGLLWASALLALALEPPDPARGGRPFQRALGGFGLGACLRSEWCFLALDPRLESACAAELRPVPGGPCASADHDAGLTAFRSAPWPAEGPP